MKIFLAAPFTSLRDPGSGIIGLPFQEWLERIITSLESLGHEVVNSHRRELFGARLDSPEVALEKDLEGVSETDLLLAYMGDPPSPGVQLEIGFALALQKRVIAFAHVSERVPYLIPGLSARDGAYLLRFEDLEDLVGKLTRLTSLPQPPK